MRRLCLALALAAACGDGKPAPPDVAPVRAPAESPVPDRVTYDQILITFKGSYVLDGKVVVDTERTKEEASALAANILERAQAGFDFEALKQEYSDDRHAETRLARGPYQSANNGVKPQGFELPRRNLHPGLAVVVYRLKVGEVGMVPFDERAFPDGWLVVKRLR